MTWYSEKIAGIIFDMNFLNTSDAIPCLVCIFFSLNPIEKCDELVRYLGVEHGGCRSDESPAYIRSEEHRVDPGALRLYQVLFACVKKIILQNFVQF